MLYSVVNMLSTVFSEEFTIFYQIITVYLKVFAPVTVLQQFECDDNGKRERESQIRKTKFSLFC